MLTAKKSAWFEKIFALYNRNLFKWRFHSFKICGLENLRQGNRQTPLIIYANHSSWWDGLAAFEISRAARLDSFIMMEEQQLRKLFLFCHLGAFSVIRENPRDAVKSINYAAHLLRESPDRALWIFPQGEILPNDARPLKFYNGISKIVEKTEKCLAVSLAIRYEFLGEVKPQIFVKIGAPESVKPDENFNAKTLTRHFAGNLTGILDELKIDILLGRFDEYEKIV